MNAYLSSLAGCASCTGLGFGPSMAYASEYSPPEVELKIDESTSYTGAGTTSDPLKITDVKLVEGKLPPAAEKTGGYRKLAMIGAGLVVAFLVLK